MQELEPSTTCSQPLTTKGWGAFFFPPIFVGTHLERQTLHSINGGGRAFVKALDTQYKGCLTIVSREGLVAVAEPRKGTAIELLSEIMATLLFRSVSAYGVRERDLVQCSIHLGKREIEGGVWICSTGNKVLLEAGFEGWYPKFYHPDNIKGFIKRAELMTQDAATRMDLMLLLEAFTLHQESAFTASLLLSWLGVERWLVTTWRRLLEKQGAGNGMAGALSDAGWPVGWVIEMLRLCGRIDSQTYDRVKKLYHRHNEIISLADRAAGSESEACFHFLLSELRKTTLAPE